MIDFLLRLAATVLAMFGFLVFAMGAAAAALHAAHRIGRRYEAGQHPRNDD